MQHKLKWVIGLAGCIAVSVVTGCQPNAQELATDTLNPTPSASETEAVIVTPTTEITPLPTPSPFSFPATIEVPPVCDGSPPTRLIIGERARITDEDPTDLNVRARPGATVNNVPIDKLRVGEVIIVLDGPVCSDRYTWYEVDTGDLSGWIAEGDLEVYYVEPFLGQ